MIATFIPLVPIILILLRKIAGKEPFNLLTIICLLGFLEGFIRANPSLNVQDQPAVHFIFSLIPFLLFTQLFRTCLKDPLRSLLNIFLAAFLSALITYGSVKGWGAGSFPADLFFSGVLCGIIFLSLPPIIRAGDWQIFRTPLFWIAGGTLFYLLLFLLLEWIGACCSLFSPSRPSEKMLFLSIVDPIRYLLYAVAVLVYRPKKVEEEY